MKIVKNRVCLRKRFSSSQIQTLARAGGAPAPVPCAPMSTVAPCCAERNPGRSHVRASPGRCTQVRSYKYTSPDDTLLESLFLHRFWACLVRRCVPEWVAPNLLTFVGLLHALAAYALLLVHSPDLNGTAPGWVYVACAWCLFVYQTMDGMDGKQARRVGAGSALGEVVDHGSDAIVSCIYGVFLVDVFGIGLDAGWMLGTQSVYAKWPALFLTTYSRVAFAMDSVVAVYTGKLPVARLDAQELQVVIQLVLLWNAFNTEGVSYWKQMVSLKVFGVENPMPLGAVIVTFGAGAGLFSRLKSTRATLLSSAPPSPHLGPAYAKGPLMIYAKVLSFECVLTASLAYAKQFPLVSLITTVAFGECMIRVMHLRVSDREFNPLSSMYCAAYVAAAAFVPGVADTKITKWTPLGVSAAQTSLVLAVLWEYLGLFAALAQQLTGCLGLPANPFVLRRKQN